MVAAEIRRAGTRRRRVFLSRPATGQHGDNSSRLHLEAKEHKVDQLRPELVGGDAMMLLTQALLIAWLAAQLMPRRQKLLALLVALATLIPLSHGVSAAMPLYGLWGEPSITTLQLLVLSLLGRTPPAFSRGWRGPACIVASATLLYPLALGLGDVDPYRLGYQPWLLVAVLGLAAIAAWWRGQPLYLWLLAVDL